MPVQLIPCRNSETGATAEIPETALPHMSSWQPIDQDPADGEQAPADITSDPDPGSDTAEGEGAKAKTTRKSTAAKATTSKKED